MTSEKAASKSAFKFQKFFLEDIQIFWVAYILV